MHLPNQLRQEVARDIGLRLRRNGVENRRTADEYAGKNGIPARDCRLFDETANDPAVIRCHYTASGRILNSIYTDGCKAPAASMEGLHRSQVGRSQDVGIENPEGFFVLDPRPICQEGTGAAQQSVFLKNADVHPDIYAGQKLPDLPRMGMDV